MSGYHVEHGIKEETQQKPEHRRRPDLSTFFSTLDVVDTSGSRQPQNAHSIPHPSDISAAYRTLANAFEMMRDSSSSSSSSSRNSSSRHAAQDPHSNLMESLIESLMSAAEHPPTKVAGVSDEFIAQLERVDKKELQKKKADGTCPICANLFLEDAHPLVVRLPCHDDHVFDLECIEPWLKLNPTCPLDRKELVRKKVEVPKVEDDEEELDDMYS